MDSKLCAYPDSRHSHTERGLGTVEKHAHVKSQNLPRDIWKETKNGFCLNHSKAFATIVMQLDVKPELLHNFFQSSLTSKINTLVVYHIWYYLVGGFNPENVSPLKST